MHRRSSDQNGIGIMSTGGEGSKERGERRVSSSCEQQQQPSFISQVRMRLKKEKPNANHYSSRSSVLHAPVPVPSSTSPFRLRHRRPYSCDASALATDRSTGGQHSNRPFVYDHRQDEKRPFLASLGNRRTNSSYQKLSSVADDEDMENTARGQNLKPPMACEEDFGLESSLSSSPMEDHKSTCQQTGAYLNFMTSKKEPTDRIESRYLLMVNGELEKALGPRCRENEKAWNYSNRPSTGTATASDAVKANLPALWKHEKLDKVNTGSPAIADAWHWQVSRSLIDPPTTSTSSHVQQQNDGTVAASASGQAAAEAHTTGFLGSPKKASQPCAPCPNEQRLWSASKKKSTSNTSKCQTVLLSVASFDNDQTPCSNSYQSTDIKHLYQRSSSAKTSEPQKENRSPRGSLRRGKAVDLSHCEPPSPVRNQIKEQRSSSATAVRSKRSGFLKKLIGAGSGSRHNSEDSPCSSLPNQNGSFMAASLTCPTGAARSTSSVGLSANVSVDPISSVKSDFSSDSSDFKYEERLRRRIFAHYDCVSICADAKPLLIGTSRLKDSNLTASTGASHSKPFLISTNGKSAGSLDAGALLSPDESSNSEQQILGKSNDILLSCPYFLNELGGEPIRSVSLTRDTYCTGKQPRSSTISCNCPSCLYPYDPDALSSACLSTGYQSQSIDETQETWHRSATAAEASVLENLSNVYLGGRLCAKRQPQLVIEHVDQGAFYYRHCFSGRAHQNYLGVDENLGPVAVSVIRDKLEAYDARKFNLISPYLYRLIVRLSDLTTYRGAILEESLPSYLSAKESREQQLPSQSSQQLSNAGPMTPSAGSTSFAGALAAGGTSAVGGSGSMRSKIPVKELLELTIPEMQASCLRLAVPVPRTEELLLKLDEQAVYNRYKVGILYCRAQQSTEEQMYNNETSGPAFDEFLDMLGQRVRLKGFDKYKGGLDCKGDTTGAYSLYTSYQQYEIMFHVSTMLPFTPQNRQQLSRKRHIGNDIVTVVFQEPGALPFSPQTVRSHFQHVFIVVRAHKPNTDNVRYSVAISRFKDVPRFGPPIPPGATFPKSKDLRDFLLTKIINAENAVHKSEKFATMAARTRREFMRDLAENHTTSHTLDGGASKIASILLGGSAKRKDRPKPKLYLDAFVHGAIVWEVQVLTQVEDFSLCRPVECYLGISADNIVLIEQSTQEALFCTPTHSVIGWTSHGNSLKLYYDHADVIILRTLDDEDSCEMQEIIKRLQAVTKGCETVEMILRRGNTGQLGFNIQHEGIVSDVEMYGSAWQAGLRQGSRIVEICKVSVATLTHERMLELLRTSVNLRVLVIPPLLEDGSPRRGCEDPYCSAVLGDDWPTPALANSGSFSNSRTQFDTITPSNPNQHRQSLTLPQNVKIIGSSISANLNSAQQPAFENDRRPLSSVIQPQAIIRLRATEGVDQATDFQATETGDYGYDAKSGNYFTSKSLDDIQHRRDRRRSEDIRCVYADQAGGAGQRYRPVTSSRLATNAPDGHWPEESTPPAGPRVDTMSSSTSSEVSTDLTVDTLMRKPTRPSELKRRVDRANSDMHQRTQAVGNVLERTSTDPSSSGVVGTPPRAPPLPPRNYRNAKCNSAILPISAAVCSSSSGLGSASDRSSSPSLNTSHLGVPISKQRSSSSSSSVQENLLRLISDLESSGDIEEAMIISSALQRLSDDNASGSTLRQARFQSSIQYRSTSPRPNAVGMLQRSPEKERGAEWSTLVDAAARAIEGLSHRSASASTNGSPELSGYRLRLQAALQRVKLLEEKVDRVQSELDTARESKRDLEIEVLRLRDSNKRLEEECTHAKLELKKFTEWFFNAVENSSSGDAGDMSGHRFPSGLIPFADDGERKNS